MSKRENVVNLAREHSVKRVAEVGVWSGTQSVGLATLPELEELILIDPWTADLNEFEEDGEMYRCSMRKGRPPPTQEQCDALADKVTALFADNPKVTIIRKTSEEAAGVIPDGSLDMVYIDAIHLYPHVKHDIELWLPKLREGGIISGDDYNIEEVRRAVDEFGGCEVVGSQVWWKAV
jgi:hypothetical protein